MLIIGYYFQPIMATKALFDKGATIKQRKYAAATLAHHSHPQSRFFFFEEKNGDLPKRLVAQAAISWMNPSNITAFSW